MTLACAEAFQKALPPYLQAESLLAQDKSENVSNLLHQSLAALDQLCDPEHSSDAYKRLTEAVHKTMGQDLTNLRETFKSVSSNLIEIGKATGLPAAAPAVKVYRCPMVKANWIQAVGETANPYYGSEMLTCGGPIESLPKTESLLAAANHPTTLPAGEILAIPRSSVIDTGRNKIVYVESAPGLFDMHAVKLGALAGEYYPVMEGLSRGDRVVTEGAFLIDAENRLNPMH